MTRARYLILIPALYQWLEQSGKAIGKDFDRLSRDLHFDLLKALLQNESTAIGKESGRNIVRTPSEIYWTALRRLALPLSEYLKRAISEISPPVCISEGRGGTTTRQPMRKTPSRCGIVLSDSLTSCLTVLPGGHEFSATKGRGGVSPSAIRDSQTRRERLADHTPCVPDAGKEAARHPSPRLSLGCSGFAS